jgi:hypothetical protein
LDSGWGEAKYCELSQKPGYFSPRRRVWLSFCTFNTGGQAFASCDGNRARDGTSTGASRVGQCSCSLNNLQQSGDYRGDYDFLPGLLANEEMAQRSNLALSSLVSYAAFGSLVPDTGLESGGFKPDRWTGLYRCD